MRKVEALSAWLFFCLGLVLLGLSILAVPQNAFAQSGGDCSTVCCNSCYPSGSCNMSSACYTDCYAVCDQCVTECQGNQSCINACYATAGDDVNCMNNCMTINCMLAPCEVGVGCNAERNGADCTGCKCKEFPGNSNVCLCYYLPGGI